jgi:hypothetical protein
MSLVSDELHFVRPPSPDHPKNPKCDDGDLFNEKHAAAPAPLLRTSAESFHNSLAPIEPYPADAFAALTFCFPGFDDDMDELFENGTQDAGYGG